MKLIEDQVSDLIDMWHSVSTELKLHEFLGWSWAEYTAWVETGVIPDRED